MLENTSLVLIERLCSKGRHLIRTVISFRPEQARQGEAAAENEKGTKREEKGIAEARSPFRPTARCARVTSKGRPRRARARPARLCHAPQTWRARARRRRAIGSSCRIRIRIERRKHPPPLRYPAPPHLQHHLPTSLPPRRFSSTFVSSRAPLHR